MEMNESQSALWQKLASFNINEGDETYTFESRLAKENGWSRDYANRVVAEYRKFVFLCAAAGHPCSPSEAVDEAWHLHMIYTRSYWERLCPLLPRPLHHHPSKGGAQETAKFDGMYLQTLDAYRCFFGEEPPSDIWPPAERRFDAHPVKVDTRHHWIVSKRAVRRAGVAAAVGSGGFFTIVGFGQVVADVSGGAIAMLVGGVAVLVGAIAAAVKSATEEKQKRNLHGCSAGTGCGTGGSGYYAGSGCGLSGGDSGSSGGGGGDGGGGGGCSSGDGGGGGCGSGCGGGGCGGGCGGGG